MTKSPDPTLASLAGQVALITGGGRGIGRMTALALARAGVKVAVAARSQDELDETVRLVEAQAGQAIAFALDVAEPAAVEHMVSETVGQLGPVDLLINNAAMTGKADQGWALADDWWRVMEVNLRGPYLCARAVLPGMVARQRGRIINVSSNAGVRPTPPYSAYSTSKAALIRLTDSLAEMTQDQGIRGRVVRVSGERPGRSPVGPLRARAGRHPRTGPAGRGDRGERSVCVKGTQAVNTF